MEKSRVEKIRNIIYPFVGCLIGIISSGFICLIVLVPLGIMLIFMAEAAIVMLLIIGGIGGIVGFIIGRYIAKRKNKKDNSFRLIFLDYFISVIGIIIVISISFFAISFNSIIEPDFDSQLSKKEYDAKLLFQADKSIIGKWYGLDSYAGNNENFDYWEFKEDGTFSFYGGHTVGKYENHGWGFDGVYTIDDSKFPIVMEYTLDSYPRKNHLVFLSENEIRVLDNMSTTLDGGPIFTRVIVGEKNFLDFKMPKRASYLPTASSKILDKELKGFWENSIKNSEEKLFYWQHGNYGRYLIYPNSNKELLEGLQDMNYKHIEQVQLDNGEVLLMVYFLGKKHFQDVRELNENYQNIWIVKERSIHYGLLFKKGNDGWKLINTLTSSDYKGGRDITLEAIKRNQNTLINQGVFNIELRSFVNQSLPAFINLETNKIVAQTNFPLKGNWGNAFGLSMDASTWKKSDFEANITKLNNEDDRLILSQSYNNGWIDAEGRPSIDYFAENGSNEEVPKNISLEPLTFKPQILDGKLEVDGIIYNAYSGLKFQKIDGNWKLVEMNITRRPTE